MTITLSASWVKEWARDRRHQQVEGDCLYTSSDNEVPVSIGRHSHNALDQKLARECYAKSLRVEPTWHDTD